MRKTRWWLSATVAAVALALPMTVAASSQADENDKPEPKAPPAHMLTGYWQNFINDSSALKLSDVPAEYDLIAVAFAETDESNPGAVDFTVDPELSDELGGYTDDDVAADVEKLHGEDRQAVLSVGGEKGSVSVTNPDEATNFADSVFAAMEKFGFDGVDIDLEHGVNSEHMASALQQLSEKAGGDITITMAPQTVDMQSTDTEYFKLATEIKDILTVVNMQYYNSGSMSGCDGEVYEQGTVEFLTGLACIQLENGLRPDQVGLGLPATSQAAGGGHVEADVVNAALDCLATGENCGSHQPPQTYPEIRGAMTWSVNWDATADYGFANTVGSHLDELP